MLLSGIISVVAGLAEAVNALPDPLGLGVPQLSSSYPRKLPLDIQPRQVVVQIPPSINKNEFTCPSTTDKKMKLEHLQIAMNDFTYIFYTKKDVKKAFERYVAKEYVQHNPQIGDGRTPAIEALTPLIGNATTKIEIARIMVGPEYTTVHSRASFLGGPAMTLYDVFRTQGSCIVEHWDGMQVIEESKANPHAWF